MIPRQPKRLARISGMAEDIQERRDQAGGGLPYCHDPQARFTRGPVRFTVGENPHGATRALHSASD